MKRIFLLSDDHGHSDAAILHHASHADEIWHAGDWLNHTLWDALNSLKKPLRCVYGNADGSSLRMLMPEHLFFEVEGLKVLIIHIGGYPGKYSKNALGFIRANQPDIFVCGHSHILRVDRDPAWNQMLCLNPGSCGFQGFHKVRTALLFSLEQGRVFNMEAIEFGRRG